MKSEDSRRKHALAAVLLAATLAGCAGANRAAVTAETLSNTVWQEACAEPGSEAAYLRFLPDGTFAYSTTGLNPGDFRHDGDDRWGVVDEIVVVSWDNDARTTQYRRSAEEPGVYVGNSPGACAGASRLAPVE